MDVRRRVEKVWGSFIVCRLSNEGVLLRPVFRHGLMVPGGEGKPSLATSHLRHKNVTLALKSTNKHKWTWRRISFFVLIPL
jgi:hypothetical protein